MRVVRLASIVAVLGLAAGPVLALEPGTTTRQPVAPLAGSPPRQALIVAPAPGGGVMAADADAYDATLRQQGFAVTTVVAATRPELEHDLRRFAAAVTPGSEVALFLLGSLPARGDQLYLVAGSAAPDLLERTDLLTTEGVAVSDLLRRVAEHEPKEVVAIIDTCRAQEGASDCREPAAALPESVSAVVASRRHGGEAGPVAHSPSLRADLVPLMRQPNLSFFALYGALGSKLAGTDMMLSATPSLSRTFTFLPDAAPQHAEREPAQEQRKDADEGSRPAAPSLPANADDLCSSFALNYFTAQSASNGVALAFMSKAYSPSVFYYGDVRSGADIVEEKKKFVAQWPTRSFRVVKGHYDFVGADKCRIKTTVEWSVGRRSQKKKGTADFEATLLLGADPLIVSQSGDTALKDP